MKYSYNDDGTRSIQHCLDNYSLGIFGKCPRRYKFQVLQGYSPRESGADKSFGIAFHKAMEVFCEEHGRYSFDEALARALMSALPLVVEEEGNNYHTQENLIRAVTCYLEKWGYHGLCAYTGEEDPMTEYRIEVPLNDKYSISIRVDKFVKDQYGDLWVGDYKTTKKTLNEDYFNSYDLDSQVSAYIWACRKAGYNVKGFIVDGIQLAVSFNRYVKHHIIREDWMLDEWYHSTMELVDQMERASQGNMDYYPNWASCYLCPFKRVCRVSPHVRSEYLKEDFTQNLEVK